MNKVQLLGNITRDVELKYNANGFAIASFGVAYNESRKQQDGNYQDVTHFFDVTALGKKAETINNWFRKGSKILIDGSLQYESWTTQDGQKRSKVVVKLNDFDFIDKKQDNQQQSQSYQPPPTTYENQRGQAVPPPNQMPKQPAPIQQQMYMSEDEIPFNGGIQ